MEVPRLELAESFPQRLEHASEDELRHIADETLELAAIVSAVFQRRFPASHLEWSQYTHEQARAVLLEDAGQERLPFWEC